MQLGHGIDVWNYVCVQVAYTTYYFKRRELRIVLKIHVLKQGVLGREAGEPGDFCKENTKHAADYFFFCKVSSAWLCGPIYCKSSDQTHPHAKTNAHMPSKHRHRRRPGGAVTLGAALTFGPLL